jgi:polar amino acid transport system substrate-binding protein
MDKVLAKDPVNRFATTRELTNAFNDAMSSPSQTTALTEKQQANSGNKYILSRRSWIIVAVVAALTGILFISSPFMKSNDPVVQSNNPTEHIAQATTSSTGFTQWTYGCLGNGDSAIVDLGCREIRIAVENRILPYNYIYLETNQPGGMDYDMWWEICSRLHCQPVFIEQKWETMLDEIGQGKYDAASEGITITEARRKTHEFSVGYLNIEQRLVVRKGESRFSNISEFLANKELIAGALENSTNFQIAKQYIPEDRIKSYQEYSTVFYALATGDIDAAIADQVEGEDTVSGIEFQQAINLEFIGTSLSSDQFGVVFPKNSDLVEPINKALQDMRVQGVLDKLIARYFGLNFNITYDDIGLGAYGQ